MNTAAAAVAHMKHLHDTGADVGLGECLHTCRTAWGLPGGSPSAAAQWQSIPAAHRHDGAAPLGAPLFWTGGTHGYGHIAISDGAGHVWTTDLPTAQRVGRIPVGDVVKHWPNHEFAGWADMLEGQKLPLT